MKSWIVSTKLSNCARIVPARLASSRRRQRSRGTRRYYEWSGLGIPEISRPPLAGEERTLSDRIEVVDFVSALSGDATFGGPVWGMERFAPT
jgi:hypothetical protein